MIFESHGTEAVITSANDRTHKQGSLHYQDRALDLRVHSLSNDEKDQVASELRSALGLDYDVLLEDQGTPTEHIHIDYDPH